MVSAIVKCLFSRTQLFKCCQYSTERTNLNFKKPLILGIESSCDETGSAIVDRTGAIFADTIHSQQEIHLRHGGIIGPIAQNLHRQNIVKNISTTLTKANITMNDIDAIAVTNRPGLLLSLTIGVRYARHLSRLYGKPIIPIHHMQAHALTARAEHLIDYPFLCLLASGGHCILTFVQSTTEFLILGETIDNAPGQCLDTVARELQLRNLPQFAHRNGGSAIECAAETAKNPDRFKFALPLAQERNCQFSFSGIKSAAYRFIAIARERERLAPDQIIQNYDDLCAAYLRAITKHMMHRTQRAIEYCERKELWDEARGRRLVFSGGVACNDFIFTALEQLGKQFDCNIYRPTRKLCTDNGIMIAWNGVERWLLEEEKYTNSNIDDIEINTKEPIGMDLTADVEATDIKCVWAKIPILSSRSSIPNSK